MTPFNALDSDFFEKEADDRLEGFSHVALIPEFPAKGVADFDRVDAFVDYIDGDGADDFTETFQLDGPVVFIPHEEVRFPSSDDADGVGGCLMAGPAQVLRYTGIVRPMTEHGVGIADKKTAESEIVGVQGSCALMLDHMSSPCAFFAIMSIIYRPILKIKGNYDMPSRIKQRIQSHPLVQTLVNLRGNPKACVFTEPLWNIPHSLYSPFFTVYMYALGVDDRQIGVLLSIGMVMQVMTILLGGVLNDKLGRRWTTLIFDTIAWSVPTLLWAVAQDYTWFLVAAVFNGFWQITSNSWNCLLVEDAEEQDLVSIYTWVTITGLLSVFFAPLTAVMVSRMGLVPTMRILLFVTCILMTTKFVVLHLTTTETKQGKIRMAETKGVPIHRLMQGYQGILKQLLASKRMMVLLGILTIHNITSTINGNFFSLLATQNLGIPEQWLAYYPMLRSVIMLSFFFFIQHLVNHFPFQVPLTVGVVLYILSQGILLVAPRGAGWLLILYIVLDAFAAALFMPQKDTLTTVFVDRKERSRLISLIYIIMIAISTPFGWLSGVLSDWNRRAPFAMNVGLFMLCLILVVVVVRDKDIVGKT